MSYKKEALHHDYCPSCGSRELQITYTLLVTLDDWPFIFLFAGIVGLASKYLELPSEYMAFFIAISLIPLLFRFYRKRTCSHCGTQTELTVQDPLLK